MRKRPTARVIVLDSDNRVLLFRFVFKTGPLAGTVFWATPGGALEAGETFEAGARRELFEETGIIIENVNEPVVEREFELRLPDGELAWAEEKIFFARTVDVLLKTQNQTAEELEFLSEHRWWRTEDLRSATETIYPKDIADILDTLLRQELQQEQ